MKIINAIYEILREELFVGFVPLRSYFLFALDPLDDSVAEIIVEADASCL
jgi:hypothetical protein